MIPGSHNLGVQFARHNAVGRPTADDRIFARGVRLSDDTEPGIVIAAALHALRLVQIDVRTPVVNPAHSGISDG